MTNDQITFLGELITLLSDTRREFDKFAFSLEHHPGKNYWTIDTQFERTNSKYTDCVVFYPDDSFNSEEIIKDLKAIIAKGRTMCS